MKNVKSIIKKSIDKISSNPTFIFENWDGTRAELSMLSSDKTKDGTKYPLIICHADLGNQIRGGELGVDSIVTCYFYIVAETKQNYTASQREDEIFDKIIYPLYDEFMLYLFQNQSLIWNEEPLPNPKHMPTETENIRFLVGKNNAQNEVNDIVDALKIKINLKIRR